MSSFVSVKVDEEPRVRTSSRPNSRVRFRDSPEDADVEDNVPNGLPNNHRHSASVKAEHPSVSKQVSEEMYEYPSDKQRDLRGISV